MSSCFFIFLCDMQDSLASVGMLLCLYNKWCDSPKYAAMLLLKSFLFLPSTSTTITPTVNILNVLRDVA